MIRENAYYNGLFPELEPNTIFRFKGEYFRVVSIDLYGCTGCAFRVRNPNGGWGCVFSLFPYCCEDQRKDHKEVIFKNVYDMEAIASMDPLYFIEEDEGVYSISKKKKEDAK